MGVVAEHIEARASGRKQHGIAGLRSLCGRADGILERRAHLQGADAFQSYCDGGGVSPDEHRVADLSAEGVGKDREVLILAIAASDHHQRTLHATHRGDGKNQDFAVLADAFRGKVRHTVLIGRDAAAIAVALKGVCTLEMCSSLEDAVRAAAKAAQPGDTVLLSPACASLDMFRDYTHRGAVFTQAVKELAA